MKIKTVGLTGGIGSGKTYMASIFNAMNIPIYNSDTEAKKLMVGDLGLVDSIKDLFGTKAYLENGSLNKTFVASQIFKNEKLRIKLNNIVHPAVRSDFKKWSHKWVKAPYVINEAALFIENKTYKDFDYLISVISPLELRISRIIDRNKLDRNEILSRIESQSSDLEKIKKSDFVIYNDSTSSLYFQISLIHAEIFNEQKRNKSNAM